MSYVLADEIVYPRATEAARNPASAPPVDSGDTLVPQNLYSIDPNAAVRGGLPDAGIAPSKGEKFKEMVRQVFEASPVGIPGFAEGAIPRYFGQVIAEDFARRTGSLKLSPDEANRRFPGLPKPFTEPVYPEVAELIHKENRRKQYNQAWIDRGPEMLGGYDRLAAGLAGGLDPLNVLMGGAIGGVMKSAGLAESLATVYGSNLIGNVAGQVPNYLQSQLERQQTNLGEELKGAAIGAVGGTAFHYAVVKPAIAFFERTSAKLKAKGVSDAIAQHESGATVDVSHVVESQAAREAGLTQPRVVGGVRIPDQVHTFAPLEHPSERLMFAAADPETGASSSMGSPFGEGVALTDKEAQARNAAGTPESHMDGEVKSVQVRPDAKIINLDEPLPDYLLAQAAAELRKAGLEGQISSKELAAAPGKEVLRLLADLPRDVEADAPSATKVMQARAEANGIDGYRWTEMGADGAPSNNRALIFDHTKAEVVGSQVADKAKVPQMTPEQSKAAAEQAIAPERQRLVSDDATAQVMEAAKRIETEEKSTERFRQEEMQARAAIERRLKEAPGPAAEEARKALEAIQRDHLVDRQMAEGFDVVSDCLGGNLL